jgi:hypothetical protein
MQQALARVGGGWHAPAMSPTPRAGGPVDVLLEQGRTRCFASAVDWPGWARSGRTPEAALDALAVYATRFGPVAVAAGVRFPARAGEHLAVVETVAGNATTDFGAPGVPGTPDSRPLTAAVAHAQVALLQAAWAALDAAAAAAPDELRKGPRGGGRDRDEVVRHVAAAESAYARKVAVRLPTARWEHAATRPECRAALVQALDQAWGSGPCGPNGWTARYALRRMSWHVLDHAWEIEDRATP